MSGASVARWSMSYFAAALACLLGALALMAAGYGYPGQPAQAPQTLVVVHLVALGWLSALMLGALTQFVPVLVSQKLFSDLAPPIVLACHFLGLAGLLGGFVGLDRSWRSSALLLPAGGLLLSLGFVLAIINLGATLARNRPLAAPAKIAAAGLASLPIVFGLGFVFTLALGGWVSGAGTARLLADDLSVHAAAGFGGWLTFVAMGVSYRLLAMFMLAPDAGGRLTKAVFWLGAGAIVMLLQAIPAASPRLAVSPRFLAVALGFVAVAFYLWEVSRLFRQRKRRKLELNSKMSGVALAWLAIAALALPVSLAIDAPSPASETILFIVAFGWLTGLGLAMLYKIVAFLTWLECYGHWLGKRQTPRVQDLVREERALPWFVLYHLAVFCAAAALALQWSAAFRLASSGDVRRHCGDRAQDHAHAAPRGRSGRARAAGRRAASFVFPLASHQSLRSLHMSADILSLDLRPVLRAGGEPIADIMRAISRLEPGQRLRLMTTFKPVPLFGLLDKKGFDHTESQLADDEWEVLFTPRTERRAPAAVKAAEAEVPLAAPWAEWPAATRFLDNRELEQPEPMIRTLAMIEEMRPGEVLSVLLNRKPAFLLPELDRRGHLWRGGFAEGEKAYRLTVLIREGKGETP